MMRNPISLTLTALLFTFFSISCSKESATPIKAIDPPPGAIAVETGERSLNVSSILELTPVYDFTKSSTGDRFLTIDSTFSNPDWTLVGITFRVSLSNDPKLLNIPIYEYYNNVAGDHAYSTLENDPGILNYPNWQRNSPGPSFYAQANDAHGAVPVYSYYNASTTTHLYSTDPDIASKYPGWGQKFLAWYAWAP